MEHIKRKIKLFFFGKISNLCDNQTHIHIYIHIHSLNCNHCGWTHPVVHLLKNGNR